MKSIIKIVILSVGLALVAAGCARFLFPVAGDIAIPKSRIALIEGKDAKGGVETDDMRLDYVISRGDRKFKLYGEAHISDSISYSFNSVRSFVVKMSFLNSEGMVLETIDITPLYTSHGATPEKMPLKREGICPVGTVAATFSWYGVFHSIPSIDSGSWTMHYYPFQH